MQTTNFMCASGDQNSTIKDLIQHFQNQANRIDAEKETILSNRPDIGDLRENVLFEFFQRHLPDRCIPIKGAFIFDSLGNRSKQIDVIIINDSTLQFRSSLSSTSGKSFNCIEGCYSAVSIKTRLDRMTLVDSFNNLSSIPLLKNIKPNPLIANFDKLLKQIPAKVVFAFDGDTVENTMVNINEYLDNNNYAPENLSDFIIVNNKYYLWKVGPLGIMDIVNQIPFKYGSYISEHQYTGVGAMALLHLITFIQKISNLAPNSLINFDEYVNRAETYLKQDLLPKD